MKTAVIYARYSCSNQTEQSIEGQLRVCNDFAERNDYYIVDTYIDRAMTGTNDNRAIVDYCNGGGFGIAINGNKSMEDTFSQIDNIIRLIQE